MLEIDSIALATRCDWAAIWVVRQLAELGHLEVVVERGQQTCVEVGEALVAIRDRRGYRVAGFVTFEEYLHER